jgi:hypothetical protein
MIYRNRVLVGGVMYKTLDKRLSMGEGWNKMVSEGEGSL